MCDLFWKYDYNETSVRCMEDIRSLLEKFFDDEKNRQDFCQEAGSQGFQVKTVAEYRSIVSGRMFFKDMNYLNVDQCLNVLSRIDDVKEYASQLSENVLGAPLLDRIKSNDVIFQRDSALHEFFSEIFDDDDRDELNADIITIAVAFQKQGFKNRKSIQRLKGNQSLWFDNIDNLSLADRIIIQQAIEKSC